MVDPVQKVLPSATLSTEIFCCWFLIKNHLVMFVPSTTVKRISFCNHRYKKVVVVKHNVVLLYVDANAPDPSGVVLWNPFKWDILCSFLIKNLVIFVSATSAKWISFCNHRNRKFVLGKRNVLVHYMDVSALQPSGVVLCNCFKWDILLFVISDQNHAVCIPA